FNPDANLVEFLSAPAQIAPDVIARIEEIARQTVNAYGINGIMAIEFFKTADNEVFVNEVAPRPHNSGHHTIEANATSQYEQHLRAILNLPLGSTKQNKFAAMVNLLGADGHKGPVMYEGLTETLSVPEVYVHIYGKALTKPFRKMGHVTATASSHREAAARALEAKDKIQVKTAK
ncbi:MAG: ATP-grasp domain-containing protein, partial [Cryomorphaceae bacterium]